MKSNKIIKASFLGMLFIGLVIFASDSTIKWSIACDPIVETEAIVLWNTTYVWDGQDTASSIVKIPTGGYAIAGWTNTSGKGDYDSLFMRIANDGTHILNRTFGYEESDKGFQVINCDSGGFALISTFTNTSASMTNNDILITRIADNGNVLWNKSYCGPTQVENSHWVDDRCFSIFECANDDFIVSGVSEGIDPSDIWLMRIAPNGIRKWHQTFHNLYVERCFAPHSVLECQDGGLVVVGYTYNSTLTNRVWLIRTDSNGNEQWNKTFGDIIGYQRPEALVECSDGGFGIIANTHSFGNGGADAWLIRTDSFGNQLWNKTYGGTEEDGAGYLMEMADSGFTVLGSTHSFGDEQGDIWMIRTDENGTVVWNHTINAEFGNSAAAFAYDGADIYTIAGNTNREGVPLGDIWTLKIMINTTIITPTPSPTPTETSDYPGIVFSVGIMSIIFIVIRVKKRRYSE